jgi:LmbE family N-acetylglucosaminyl deacetylase
MEKILAQIVPATSEEAWSCLLEELPPWRPSSWPMLIVAPHPDDEILGVGGLIAAQRSKGVEISVVAVTDGEHAYPGEDSAALGQLRSTEQTAALERVGVSIGKITRFRLPDSDVTGHLPELIERLSQIVSPKTQIVAPWAGDFHPDHQACGMAADQVARALGASVAFYFFWTWHHGTPESLSGLPLRAFPLDDDSFHAKCEALQCHRSQLFRQAGEPILPQSLLGPSIRRVEMFMVP